MVNQARCFLSAHDCLVERLQWQGFGARRIRQAPTRGPDPDVSTFRGSGPKAEAAFNNWCPVAGEFIDATVRFLQQGPQVTVQ